MTTSQVRIELTGEEAKAAQAVNRLIRQQAKMQGELGKTTKTSGGTRKSFEKTFSPDLVKGFSNSLGGITTALTGAGGVLAAAKLVRVEFDQIIRRQREAAQTQVPLSASRQAVLRNLVGVDPQQKQQILGQLGGIATQTGVLEQTINLAAAEAISASGGRPGAALAAVGRAARFAPDAPDAIPGLAGSLLDLGKVTGTNDPRINQGFLAFVASQSRVVSPKAQAANIPAALINQVTLGSSAAEAAALFSTLTVAGADVTGERSGTAAISLTEQLRKFFTGTNVATTTGRIRALQQSPALAKKFIAKASFEKKSVGVIESLLLAPESGAARLFEQQLAVLPGNEALGRIADETVGARGLDPLERVGRFARTLDVGIERLRGRDPLLGIAGVARERLGPLLRAAGRGGIAQRIETSLFELETGFGSEGVLDAVISDIESVQEQLRPRTFQVQERIGTGSGRLGIGALTGDTQTIIDQPTQGERNTDRILGEMLRELRRLNGSLERPALAPVNDDPVGN